MVTRAMPYAQQEQVDRLEEALTAFAHDVREAQLRTDQEIRALKVEMSAFRRDLHAAQLRTEQGTQAPRAETSDFNQEMRDYKEESRRENRAMNRRWGELANKMGTMVEDLVVPSLPRVLREVMDLELDSVSARTIRHLPEGGNAEFDGLAFAGGLVVLNITKSTLRQRDVDAFPEEIARFRPWPGMPPRPQSGQYSGLSVSSILNGHSSGNVTRGRRVSTAA
jgi:hypothetical protein